MEPAQQPVVEEMVHNVDILQGNECFIELAVQGIEDKQEEVEVLQVNENFDESIESVLQQVQEEDKVDELQAEEIVVEPAQQVEEESKIANSQVVENSIESVQKVQEEDKVDGLQAEEIVVEPAQQVEKESKNANLQVVENSVESVQQQATNVESKEVDEIKDLNDEETIAHLVKQTTEEHDVVENLQDGVSFIESAQAPDHDEKKDGVLDDLQVEESSVDSAQAYKASEESKLDVSQMEVCFIESLLPKVQEKNGGDESENLQVVESSAELVTDGLVEAERCQGNGEVLQESETSVESTPPTTEGKLEVLQTELNCIESDQGELVDDLQVEQRCSIKLAQLQVIVEEDSAQDLQEEQCLAELDQQVINEEAKEETDLQRIDGSVESAPQEMQDEKVEDLNQVDLEEQNTQEDDKDKDSEVKELAQQQQPVPDETKVEVLQSKEGSVVSVPLLLDEEESKVSQAEENSAKATEKDIKEGNIEDLQAKASPLELTGPQAEKETAIEALKSNESSVESGQQADKLEKKDLQANASSIESAQELIQVDREDERVQELQLKSSSSQQQVELEKTKDQDLQAKASFVESVQPHVEVDDVKEKDIQVQACSIESAQSPIKSEKQEEESQLWCTPVKTLNSGPGTNSIKFTRLVNNSSMMLTST